MDTNEKLPIDTKPQDHRIRLLLPIFLPRNTQHQAAKLLAGLIHQTPKEWPCWEQPMQPASLYRDETLPSVAKYLIGEAPSCCAYVKVPDDTAAFWFKKNGVFSKGHTTKTADELPVKLAKPGIELFLSPHGVGIFSVTFEPIRKDNLSDLQRANYCLSQIRDQTSYCFSLPHSDKNSEPRPEASAPLVDRLGKAGGEFKLLEWVRFLLEPLAQLGYRIMQQQFMVYSVTRFNASVDFTDTEAQTALRPYLTALAHVEELNHAGSLKVCEQALNPRHWAAVGSLGAVHLLADQNQPAKDFDEQRLGISLHKYFIPYLVGLIQRVVLQGILEEARDILGGRCADEPEESGCWVVPLQKLNRHTLAFTVNGWFTEVSSREVINQYYTLAQQGLRVQDSFRNVQRALHDAEVIDDGHFQNNSLISQTDSLNRQNATLKIMEELAHQANQSVSLVAHVQTKVEWLEVFFVSYYATALVYYINHDNALFNHIYSTWSLGLAPIVSGIIAFIGLGLHKMHKHQDLTDKSTKFGDSGLLIGLTAMFAIWLVVGFIGFQAEPHPETSSAHPEIQAEPAAKAPSATPAPSNPLETTPAHINPPETTPTPPKQQETKPAHSTQPETTPTSPSPDSAHKQH